MEKVDQSKNSKIQNFLIWRLLAGQNLNKKLFHCIANILSSLFQKQLFPPHFSCSYSIECIKQRNTSGMKQILLCCIELLFIQITHARNQMQIRLRFDLIEKIAQKQFLFEVGIHTFYVHLPCRPVRSKLNLLYRSKRNTLNSMKLIII